MPDTHGLVLDFLKTSCVVSESLMLQVASKIISKEIFLRVFSAIHFSICSVSESGGLSITLWNCKLTDRSRGRHESSLFNSYYTEVKGRALLFSLDCSIYT